MKLGFAIIAGSIQPYFIENGEAVKVELTPMEVFELGRYAREGTNKKR